MSPGIGCRQGLTFPGFFEREIGEAKGAEQQAENRDCDRADHNTGYASPQANEGQAELRVIQGASSSSFHGSSNCRAHRQAKAGA